jgi:hypothetical protein
VPTKTIEYIEEVTKEEEIIVCSDCRREVDKNGKHFENGGVELDFCSECLGEYGFDVRKDEFIERVEDWYEMEDEAGDTMLCNVRMARKTAVMSVLELVAFGPSLYLYLSTDISFLGGISAIFLILLFTTTILNLVHSIELQHPEFLKEQ